MSKIEEAIEHLENKLAVKADLWSRAVDEMRAHSGSPALAEAYRANAQSKLAEVFAVRRELRGLTHGR